MCKVGLPPPLVAPGALRCPNGWIVVVIIVIKIVLLIIMVIAITIIEIVIGIIVVRVITRKTSCAKLRPD